MMMVISRIDMKTPAIRTASGRPQPADCCWVPETGMLWPAAPLELVSAVAPAMPSLCHQHRLGHQNAACSILLLSGEQ